MSSEKRAERDFLFNIHIICASHKLLIIIYCIYLIKVYNTMKLAKIMLFLPIKYCFFPLVW